MKIVVIGPAYPLRGGIAHYIAILYSKLKQRHKVKVISFKRQYPKLLFPGRTQKDYSQEIMTVRAIPLFDSINPISWVNTFLRIKKENPDLIIFKYWMPFFAPSYTTIVFLTRLFTTAKSLYICDNILPHERRVSDYFLSRLALKFVDYFIVQSQVVREELLRFRPDAVFREVPHPIYSIFRNRYSSNEARKKLGLADAEKVLLFFGYVRPYKGLTHLIEAMVTVSEKIKARLLIAGEFYEDKSKYLQRIKELNLEDSIKVFDKYIPNEEVGLYFAAADVVVLPYVSATQSGIVQIAYNYDKPVITTNVGGLPEVVIDGRTGYLVSPQDPQALAEAILRYFEEHRAEEFSQNIRKEKDKYSWDRLVEAIESFVN